MYQKHTWVSKEIIRREYLQNIEDGIYNEEQRALDAESQLSSDISAERTRATAKENSLTESVTGLSHDLGLEVSRATGAEETLEQLINNEIDRATGVEGELSQSLIDTNTALSNENTRATEAESTLTTNLASEVSRATTAESTLNTNLASEILRATAAESALHDYVDEKVSTTYKPSGSIYFADLPALTESRVGNVYDIKDDFTTTADFMEGAGKSYKAGTNVAIEWGEETIVTVTYDEVTPVGTENPSEEGWYELQTVGTSEEYVLTEDTTVDSGKTYYEKIETPSTQRVLKYDCMSAFVNLSNYVQKTDLATNVNAGIVKPDGTTITVDADGTIHSVGGGQGSAEAAERMIAPIEPDATESIRAYSVGRRLILDEVLYEVTQAIAIGDALIENTNIKVADTLTDSLIDEIATRSRLGAHNLIPYPYRDPDHLENLGTIFDSDSRGVITLSGTPSDTSLYRLQSGYAWYLDDGDYVFSVCGLDGKPLQSLPDGVRVQMGTYNSQDGFTEISTLSLYTTRTVHIENLNHNDAFIVRLAIYTQYDGTEISLRVLIRHLSDLDVTWQPYAKTNKELTDIVTDVDTTPTSGSTKFITSGGVYSYIDTMITQALAASY